MSDKLEKLNDQELEEVAGGVVVIQTPTDETSDEKLRGNEKAALKAKKKARAKEGVKTGQKTAAKARKKAI